ncbi:MAG TPA: UPF0280 family protein [Bryobacteraceae bacterium]|nr:UPF0280 family protein [Bryobacteraceae bacterium]
MRLLPDGKRLHLQDGPIDLVLQAFGPAVEVGKAYQAAARRFVTMLDELCSELPLLRARAVKNGLEPRERIARRMALAVAPYAERAFITPMAAVAGAVAEEILEAMTSAARLVKAYVNDGGDIALHLEPGESFAVGMVDRPDRPSLFGAARISWDDPIRGIATSGWRGRSFSLGIADAVTVLAKSSAQADAAATIIANAVDLPGNPAITRTPARTLVPDSDLLDLLVTQHVGELSPEEVSRALQAGVAVAKSLAAVGLIHSAALRLCDSTKIAGAVPAALPAPQASAVRSAIHA